MNIIYIHGFNSGKGQKALDLEKAGFKVYSPQLTNNVKEDIQILVDLVNELKSEDLHIIGCSLGGFYTLVLFRLFRSNEHIYFHAINPSMTPSISLKKKLNNTLENYKTNVKFTVTQSFLDDLQEVGKDIHFIEPDDFQQVLFYFGSEDGVLDHSKTIDWILSTEIPSKVITSEQDHRFQDISSIIEEIKLLEAIKK